MHIKRRVSGWLTLAVLTVGGAMVASDPAFAKVDMDNLTIGGEARIRYEIRINSALSSNVPSNLSSGSSRIRVNVGYDLSPDVSFFAQIQDARNWGNEGCRQEAPGDNFGNTFPGGCNGTGIGAVSSSNKFGTGLDLHQGYILVKNLVTPGLSLKIGRQEMMYGDHRLIGNFGWSQIGNAFDAVKLMYSTPTADVDVFWARIIDNVNGTAFTGSGSGGSNTGVLFPNAFANASNTQDLYGAYVTLKAVPNWTVEPYYFLLKDSRVFAGNISGGNLTAFSPQAPDQARNVLGGRINGKQGIAGGALDATLEAVWQFGGLSNVANGQHNLHINAHAEALKVGYTFDPVPMKPRIGIEVDYASGDNCRRGPTTCNAAGHFNTFDNLYPTNHFHYGYMDLMAWKNMVNYQAVFDVKPDAVSKIQVNFIIHRLANHLDDWYRAGQVAYGVTNAANTASSLGRELDIHYYRTIKEKFKFEVGVGHFWAGDYMKPSNLNNINGAGAGASTGSGQNWGYVMTSVLF